MFNAIAVDQTAIAHCRNAILNKWRLSEGRANSALFGLCRADFETLLQQLQTGSHNAQQHREVVRAILGCVDLTAAEDHFLRRVVGLAPLERSNMTRASATWSDASLVEKTMRDWRAEGNKARARLQRCCTIVPQCSATTAAELQQAKLQLLDVLGTKDAQAASLCAAAERGIDNYHAQQRPHSLAAMRQYLNNFPALHRFSRASEDFATSVAQDINRRQDFLRLAWLNVPDSTLHKLSQLWATVLYHHGALRTAAVHYEDLGRAGCSTPAAFLARLAQARQQHPHALLVFQYSASLWQAKSPTHAAEMAELKDKLATCHQPLVLAERHQHKGRQNTLHPLAGALNRIYAVFEQDQRALNAAREKLTQLTGLASAKRTINALIDSVEVNLSRQERGMPSAPLAYHAAFAGNPGTGKTTVARLYGEVLAALGILRRANVFKEVGREDLIDAHVGNTGPRVRKILESALGGVLFIDEAYALAQHGTEHNAARDALLLIMNYMENHRDDIVIVLAGYRDGLKALFGANAGLTRRVNIHLEFADYSDTELTDILRTQLAASGRNAAAALLQQAATQLGAKREQPGFGNARDCRVRVEQLIRRQSLRLSACQARGASLTAADLARLSAADFSTTPATPQPLLSGVNRQTSPALHAALTELEAMVGLQEVKDELQRLMSVVEINRLRLSHALRPDPMTLHALFTGNPGTGKTTVAHIYARVLAALGLLDKANLVVLADRDKLVSRYTNDTARKTQALLQSALGGVVFIDEAYGLAETSQKHNYGAEAMTTLIRFMEEHRDNIVIIFAGYQRDMQDFLRLNEGLRSRIGFHCNFVDYTPAQLATLLDSSVAAMDHILPADAKVQALACIEQRRSRPNFGNAGEVRLQLERARMRLASRLLSNRALAASQSLLGITNAALKTFAAEDFELDPPVAPAPVPQNF